MHITVKWYTSHSEVMHITQWSDTYHTVKWCTSHSEVIHIKLGSGFGWQPYQEYSCLERDAVKSGQSVPFSQKISFLQIECKKVGHMGRYFMLMKCIFVFPLLCTNKKLLPEIFDPVETRYSSKMTAFNYQISRGHIPGTVMSPWCHSCTSYCKQLVNIPFHGLPYIDLIFCLHALCKYSWIVFKFCLGTLCTYSLTVYSELIISPCINMICLVYVLQTQIIMICVLLLRHYVLNLLLCFLHRTL